MLKTCAYFGCLEPISTVEDLDGFVYCIEHLAYMHNMVELDSDVESSRFRTIAYCLGSLNTKAYNREELIF